MPPTYVDTGLIDMLLHPPLGAMRPFLDYYGPYSGNVSIATWSETAGPIFTPRSVTDTFGVFINIEGLIPTSWGYRQGWVSELGEIDLSQYIPPLGQLVVVHRFSNGLHIATQTFTIDSFPCFVTWDVALPAFIGLRTAPGISFDLSFLMVDPSIHIGP